MVSFVSINFMMLYTTQKIIKKMPFYLLYVPKKVGFKNMKLMLKMVEDEMSMY